MSCQVGTVETLRCPGEDRGALEEASSIMRWCRNREVEKLPGRAWREPAYWPGGIRRIGGVNTVCGGCMERGKALLSSRSEEGRSADRLVVAVKPVLGAVRVE